MKSAKEAREQAINSIDNDTTVELKRIESEINKAITRGEFHIVESGSLSPQAAGKLRSLGYEITMDSQYNMPYYGINW